MVVTMLEGIQDNGSSKMRYEHYNCKWLDYEENHELKAQVQLFSYHTDHQFTTVNHNVQ